MYVQQCSSAGVQRHSDNSQALDKELAAAKRQYKVINHAISSVTKMQDSDDE